MIVLLYAGFGVAATYGFYYMLSATWPRLYYGPSDGLQIFLSSSLAAFTVFRVLPVVVIVSFIEAYASRGNVANPGSVAAWYLILFSASTMIFRFAHSLRFGRRISLRDTLWLTASIAFTAIGSLLGFFLAPWGERLLPDIAIAQEALFTALIVAITLAFFSRVGFGDDYTDGAIAKAISANFELVSEVERRSRHLGISRYLIASIVVAEQMQRPGWFQSFENIAHAARLPVSTGPFQSRNAGRSKAAAIDGYFEASPAVRFARSIRDVREDGREIGEEIAFAMHNNSKPFVELCSAVRRTLITREFDEGYGLYELEEFGVVVSRVQIVRPGTSLLKMEFHLRSDYGSALDLELVSAGGVKDLEETTVMPGETVAFVRPSEVMMESWTVTLSSANDGPSVSKTFIPVRDLGFEPRWDK